MDAVGGDRRAVRGRRAPRERDARVAAGRRVECRRTGLRDPRERELELGVRLGDHVGHRPLDVVGLARVGVDTSRGARGVRPHLNERRIGRDFRVAGPR